MILQATALQDVAMDLTLHAEVVVCPKDTQSTDSLLSVPSPSNIPTSTPTLAASETCLKWNLKSNSIFIVNPNNLQELESDIILFKDDYGRLADLVSINVEGENIAEVTTYLIKDISTIIPNSSGIQDPSSTSNSIIHYFNQKILADKVHIKIRGADGFKINQIYFITCYDVTQVIPDPSLQVNTTKETFVVCLFVIR
jgi:hypothetical protein